MRCRPIWRAVVLETSCMLLTALVDPTAYALAANGPADAAAGESAVLRWDFEQELGSGELVGAASMEPVGPTPAMGFQGMPERNSALVLPGPAGYVRLVDNEEQGPLDFGPGDCITLEAWVRLDNARSGSYLYVIGKGRTYENGPLENHNYALRVFIKRGMAYPSFLFSTREPQDTYTYHRWTANEGVPVDPYWHHIAVSYQFGFPSSIRGYVDGVASTGRWDMGGATDRPPVNNNESLWIGSSRGGAPTSSFIGAIDGVAIHRRLVEPAELASRRIVHLQPPRWPAGAPQDRVFIRLAEGLSSHTGFPDLPPSISRQFETTRMVLHRLPAKFLPGGIRDEWRGPVMAQMFVLCEFPAGPVELLLRSPGKTRLWIDGEIIVETPPRRLFPDAHQPFITYQPADPLIRTPHVGDHERLVKWESDGKPHQVVLETLVGSASSRCEPGETLVAWRTGTEMFRILGPATAAFEDGLPTQLPLVDEPFERYLAWSHGALDRLDRVTLQQTSAVEDAFWERRHELARRAAARWPSVLPAIAPLPSLDDTLREQLESHGVSVEEIDRRWQPVEDLAFLRRLSFDTVGVPPTLDEINTYLRKGVAERRQWAIEYYLQDDRWADHWTSLWQDLLAENPNILKPSLNNTGPFRFWIHDSLVLNKPMDRFVTELIRMEGSPLAGGPAGFAEASQNDLPMAEKAHVVVAAFLGEDLKCARCHDAPYHSWQQRDLFQVAAMLAKKPIQVPTTSSVPRAFFQRRADDAPIRSTLQPGDIVAPLWPERLVGGVGDPASLDPGLLGRPDSTRERLAALMTRGENRRFPQVLAVRVWQRLIGWSLVDEPHDWESSEVRFEPVVELLARHLVESGYDMKALVEIVVSSQFYALQPIDPASVRGTRRFLAPWRRRLTAEQVVDAMHSVAGVPMSTEPITFDPEASQKKQNFLNLGRARRAWQLTSLSNERDRPSLSLPRAAAVVECLEAFGWQAARPAPVEHRQDEVNVVPPAVLANGNLMTYVSRMTDDALMTRVACEAQRPDEFVDRIFLAVLTRHPDEVERQRFIELLAPGWSRRVIQPPPTPVTPAPQRGFVTWSNHFDVRANQLMQEMERRVAYGPPPTPRLDPQWRERAEDALWALMNSPEFTLLP